MKFENTSVYNIENAIRGMRNPMNSWDKSDTFICVNGNGNCEKCRFYTKDDDNFGINEGCLKGEVLDEYTPVIVMGEKDLELAKKLIGGGTEHRKFLRQIFISVDITAPLYWWKEFDIYKIGTTSNSCSTMHKIHNKEITIDDFEMDDALQEVCSDLTFYGVDFYNIWINLISFCEHLRQRYNKTKDKRYWKELIRLLPQSYLQKRTITMNYEVIINMIKQRKGHKLTEWKKFIDWAIELDYMREFTE